MNDSTEKNNLDILYVIRFLSTQMAGCEYKITESKTLYFVGSQEEINHNQEMMFSQECIFVPDDRLSQLFEIHSDAGQLQLVTGEKEGKSKKILQFQTVHNVGGIFFSLRKEEDNFWAIEVENFDISSLPQGDEELPPKNKKKYLHFYIAFALVLIAIFAGISWYVIGHKEREYAALNNLLGSEQKNYRLLKGKDGYWYVFANDLAAKEWAVRSIQKSGTLKKSIVINIKEEVNRLSNEVQTRWPYVQFHLIRLDSPERPEMLLSQERGGVNNEHEHELFRKELLNIIPYADTIVFSSVSDTIVARQAEEGLIKIAAVFDRKITKNSLTFTSRGSLQDNELNALKMFISSFKSQWQGNYIRFEIELEKNWLKGKSYQYGVEGYVKINKEHWYFPREIYN